VPGISQGNAITAAERIGIAPETYLKALQGDPEAVKQVRDVAVLNNILPEIGANRDVAELVAGFGRVTGGRINPDLVARALFGDPTAVSAYTEAVAGLTEVEKGQLGAAVGGVTLTDIAKRLSPTGQAGILAGGHLERTLAGVLPGVGSDTRQQNQAIYGRYEIRSDNPGPFPVDAPVNSTGTEAKISKLPAGLGDQLARQGIKFVVDPIDGTFRWIRPTSGATRRAGLSPVRGRSWRSFTAGRRSSRPTATAAQCRWPTRIGSSRHRRGRGSPLTLP
jgi:hypothetical protein